ncbi:hypothetical protein C2S51_029407 [Perilla frutescens var. frutescens]|nr:hypothetical protein C2S51_029407 [Perilla frutescens var. frutescens]
MPYFLMIQRRVLHRRPKTLAANIAAFANFGYFKDLLEILFRVLEGSDARELAKEAGENLKAYNSRLRSDMEMLKSGKLNKISLASKWCPSLDSSLDRITLLCE